MGEESRVQLVVAGRTVELVKGDITQVEVDAFIYDITEDAKLGSGFGGAISVRGGKAVQQELDEIGRCPKGSAIITTAGRLPARHIIHVNGPKFFEEDTEGKLLRAVASALRLADEHQLASLAFPPIGTGLYQVPLDLCARVMVDTVMEHLRGRTSLERVVFVALDTREYEPFKARLEQTTRQARED